jgi:hypothetical protein
LSSDAPYAEWAVDLKTFAVDPGDRRAERDPSLRSGFQKGC